MQISTLIERITKEQPTISLEALLDELEVPAYEARIPADKAVKYAVLFIAKRNAIQTGEPQTVTHNGQSFEVTPN